MMKKTIVSFGFLMMAITLMTISAFAAKVDYSDEEIVKLVQEGLNAAGFDCGTPDGKVGTMTKSAVRDFRKEKGLPEGEEIDTALFNELTLNDEQLAYIKEVSEAMTKNLDGEAKVDVTLFNDDLCVIVDLVEEYANTAEEDRLSSIVTALTDEILNIDGFDECWETVTIDFGDLGEFINNKENIVTDKDGRHFDEEKYQRSKDNSSKPDSEESGSPYELAYERVLDGFTIYYLFDTDTNECIEFMSTDGYGYYGQYSGDLASSVTVYYPREGYSDTITFAGGLGSDAKVRISDDTVWFDFKNTSVEEAEKYLVSINK